MDDTTLRTLEERLTYLRNLDKRRQEVKSAIENQGKLTEALVSAIDAAATLTEVEDLYRPYKQKRRTRATVAREKGLEPLAALLFAQERTCPDPVQAAQAYLNPEKGVETVADALQGANDIIAEQISDDAAIRKTLREHDLKFTRLFMAKPHVFIGAANPLASRSSITLSDLEPYPRLSYEQGEHNSFYFSEEILSTLDSRKDILVSDRATLFNLLIGLNGYTICSGVINEELNGPNIVAIPLDVDDYMEIGYITHNRVTPGRFAGLYIEALKRRVGVPVPKVSAREPITRIPVSDR